MKNIILLILFLISLSSILSCSKDDSRSCKFIGKWCTESPVTGDCLLGVELEFRENGDLLQFGTAFFKWESKDCKTIDVINKPTGFKSAEYIVYSVSENTMSIDIGAGPVEYIRVH